MQNGVILFNFGIRKRAENTCAALRDHVVSVINAINGEGTDYLLEVPDFDAIRSGSAILWWVGDFQIMCDDSHKEGVKMIMLSGGKEFNGITISAYTDSTDPSTWKMTLEKNASGNITKGAKVMYETYAKHYQVQDLKGYLS